MVGGYLADALDVEHTRESIKAIPLDTLVRVASDLVASVQTAPGQVGTAHAEPPAVRADRGRHARRWRPSPTGRAQTCRC